jgi:hypothetical protein
MCKWFEKLDTHHLAGAIKTALTRGVDSESIYIHVCYLLGSVFEAKKCVCAQEGKLMQDKSFSQAMQDVQAKVSNHVEEAVQRMLLYHTTATHATVPIQDEYMRAVVTNELISGQIIALLALLRDEGILDKAQYSEFTTYLRRSAQHIDMLDRHTSF